MFESLRACGGVWWRGGGVVDVCENCSKIGVQIRGIADLDLT